jgi:hypothetical protein
LISERSYLLDWIHGVLGERPKGPVVWRSGPHIGDKASWAKFQLAVPVPETPAPW